MQRKSQITIFFLLGIVLLFGLFVTTVLEKETPETTLSPNVKVAFSSFIESCLNDLGEEAVYFTALQAGEYNPEEYVSYYGIAIPYNWDGTHADIPAVAEIEQSLSEYIEDNLVLCTDFSDFKLQGYDVAEEDFAVSTQLTRSGIHVQLHYPITITQGSAILELSDFSHTIDLPLLEARSYAESVLEQQEQFPDEIPVGFVTALAYQNDFEYEIIHLDSSVIISIIMDIPGKESLVYSYANKY